MKRERCFMSLSPWEIITEVPYDERNPLFLYRVAHPTHPSVFFMSFITFMKSSQIVFYILFLLENKGKRKRRKI